MPGGALDTVPAAAERDLVEIGLENLILVVALLRLPRRSLLSHLSPNTSVGAIDDFRMHVADQLLGDRARSAPLAEDVVLQRPRDPDDVDTVVLKEAVILDRDESERQVFGECPDVDVVAMFVAYLSDHRSVTREHDRSLWHRNDHGWIT